MHVPPAQPAVFEQFGTISFLSFTAVVNGIKPPNCPLDIILAELRKEVLNLGGSSLLFISTSSGCTQTCCGEALVKKTS